MKLMLKIVIYVLISSLFTIKAFSETLEIEMLNKSGNEMMVYSQKIAKINVGDTIIWKSTTKGHNVEFIKNGTPDGVEKFKSKIGKDATFTFTVPGVYAYNCTPHYGLGMIGFVVVGDDTSNLEAIEKIKYPGKAKAIAKELIEQLK